MKLSTDKIPLQGTLCTPSKKERTKTRSQWIGSIFLVATILFASSCMAGQGSPVLQDKVIARVNGKPIYEHQLTPRTKAALSKRTKYGPASDNTRQRIERAELEKLIDFELLTQASQSRCLSSTGKNDFTHPQHDQGSCIDEYLKQQGLGELNVPYSEIQKYYEQNKNSFKQGEMVKASHILLRLSRNPTADEISTAEKKIEAIRGELLQKDNFSEIAQQKSDCATASAGGDLGYINRGYMPADFDRVAFALQTGEISTPVRTRHGFHLIKVSDKKNERLQDLGEVKELIEKLLLRNARERKIAEIINELRGAASIEINLK